MVLRTRSYTNWVCLLGALALVLLVVGMPLSRPLMSIGGIGLALVFVLSPNRLAPFKYPGLFWPLLALVALFVWHVLQVLRGGDMAFLLNDLRIKLPLLAAPLGVAALAPSITTARVRILLAIYSFAVLVALALVAQYYFTDFDNRVLNIRNVVYFTSHIRLSLNVLFGAVAVCWLALTAVKDKIWFWVWCGVYLVFATWFIVLIGSGNALLVLAALVLFTAIQLVRHSAVVGRVTGFALLGLTAVATVWLVQRWQTYTTPLPGQNLLDKTTALGNVYNHDTVNLQLEQGTYVWRFIAPAECDSAWLARTGVDPIGLDASGNQLRGTLYRYLSAKGLRKDAAGVASLSEGDVANILQGIPSPQMAEYNGVERRVDQLFFEMQTEPWHTSPGTGSIFTRVAYWQTAWSLVKLKPVMGWGTGHVPAAYKTAYFQNSRGMPSQMQHRSHNQYLAVWVALGLPGLVLLVAALAAGFVGDSHFLWPYFILIAAVSFVPEDTLETQAGVTFVCGWFAVLWVSGVSSKYRELQRSHPQPK